MTKNINRQAFLIVTQKISSHVLKLYKKIKAAISDNDEVYILFHSKTNTAPPVPEGVKIEVFTNDILKNLGYNPIRTKLVPGSNHFPVLRFYLTHPEFDHYWCIEDDVVFSGDWQYLLNSLASGPEYDFITSHIRRYQDYPDWFWWDTYRVPGQDFNTNMINSFNPIYRISNKALQYIDKNLKNGYRGHHEVLLPTLLREGGFTIADFGTEQNYVTPNLSYCTLTSMRWKPVFFTAGNKKNLFYHPVKADISFDQLKDYIERTLKNRKEYLK